jgi:hypothetical protein
MKGQDIHPCQDGIGEPGSCGGNAREARSAENQPDFSSRSKRESRKIFSGGLGSHQDFLISSLRRRGPLRDKGQLEVVDDPVQHGIVGEESDDLHRGAALGAGQGIHLVHLADHFGPAFGRETPELLLCYPERESRMTGLLDLPPMGVGVEAVVNKTKV